MDTDEHECNAPFNRDVGAKRLNNDSDFNHASDLGSRIYSKKGPVAFATGPEN